MAHCVNRSSQEFIALAKQSNINPIILAAKVSLWQEEHGLDKFPVLEDISKSEESNVTEQEGEVKPIFLQLKNATPELIEEERKRFEKEGITLSQKDNIPIINKLLYRTITPATYNLKSLLIKGAYSLFVGRSYSDFINTITYLKKSSGKLPEWADNITETQYNKRDDAWALSNGLPQKHNTFKYIGKGFVKNDGSIDFDEKGEDIYDFTTPEFNDVDINKAFKKGRTYASDSENFVMGNYGISIGRDTIGYFMRYTDRWDLDVTNKFVQFLINKTQNPFVVTGKLYKAATYDVDNNIFSYYTSDPTNSDINTYTELMAQLELEEKIVEDKKQYADKKASPKLISLMKEFIKSIGVDYKLVENIVVDGVKQDANGVALVMQKLIQVVEGKEREALPEEAMHFVVEILKQTNLKLYQQLLKEIGTHSKFTEVSSLYGEHPDYQLNGKRNVIKLKEEAIAKVLADTLDDRLGMSWWDKIVEFLHNLFYAKSGMDQAVIDVLSGKISNIDDIDVSQSSNYFQLNEDESLKIFNKINEISNKTELKDDGVDNEGETKQNYFFEGVKIPKRVSDIVKKAGVYKDVVFSEFQKKINKLKSQNGTKYHNMLEYIVSTYVDKSTGLMRDEINNDDFYKQTLSPIDLRIYNALHTNISDRLISFEKGTRFMTEVIIKGKDLAGTVDFLAITPSGKINILDWKFISLDTSKKDDIGWEKVRDWNLQMKLYKNMLISNYGIKSENFEQTRMIPVITNYTKVDYKKEVLPEMISITIGDTNVETIQKDYLLPVALSTERTGIKQIDDLLQKFNDVYEKLATETVDEENKSIKAEQLKTLYKAMRHLHLKKDVIPLINQAKLLNKQVTMLIKEYNTKFKNNSIATDQEKEKFSKMLRIHLDALQPYLEIKNLRFLLKEENDENSKLRADIRTTVENVEDYISEIKNIEKEFGEKFVGAYYEAEKEVKGISKWFANTSTIQIENIQKMFKIANKANFLAAQETLLEIKELKKIEETYRAWAKSKGFSLSNYFNILTKSGKNELIDEFKPEFYSELKGHIAKKDITSVKENIDLDAYRDYLADELKKEQTRILNQIRIGTDEEIQKAIKIALIKANEKYSIEKLGLYQYKMVSKFPKKDKWQTEEWKNLIKPENTPAKDFYDYIIKRNTYYQSIGYMNNSAARTFLPWVRQGLLEGIMFNGQPTNLGEQFLRNISMDDSETGYGAKNPITGELINKIPKYLVNKFDDGNYSTDLFKTMALYNEFAIKFKNLSAVEEQTLLLGRAEQNKQSIETSIIGNIKIEEGEVKKNKTNEANYKLFQDMMKGIIYGQKYINNEIFDASLGKLGNLGKTLNEKLGMDVFPENLAERHLSVNKAINQLNKTFQLSTLGFSILSPLSNSLGGRANALINAGKYGTKTDYIKTQTWILANKMQGGEDYKKALAALDYFMPFVENYNRDTIKDFSLNKLDDQKLQDYLMYLMRNGDKAVQTLNFFFFLRNTAVINDKVVNVREYLRTTPEYYNMYSGTQIERNEKKENFEKDVIKLMEEKGVLKLGTLTNGEFNIPGISQTDDSVVEFRRKVQGFTSDALGSLTEENKRLINMNVYGASAMIFKGWIPRLADVRIGNIKYNAASDAYEWGRTRMIVGMLATDTLKTLKSLSGAITGNNDIWLDQVRKLYDKKREDYLKSTGKTLNMTEDQFIELVNRNIKNQAVDAVMLLSLMSILAMLKANAPDDEDPLVKNQWSYLVKATDKITDELRYFYSPSSLLSLFSKGLFPAMAMLENYTKFLTEFLKENFGLIVQDDKMVDDAHPIKYLMKSFPITNQAASWIPLFYPELAKDMGIKTKSTYGS